MRKLSLTALGLLVMVLFAGNAFCYTINDPVGDAFYFGNPQHDPQSFDRIGDSIYEIYGMNVSQSGSILTFDIFSNFPSIGDIAASGWKPLPADLALDLNKDGTYEYGVAFTNHGNIIAGDVYSAATWNLSNSYDPTLGQSWPAQGAGYVYHDNQIVTIAGGKIEGAGSVAWMNSTISGPKYDIRATLDTSALGSNYDGSFNVFYGGATCANDYLKGTVSPVPEPATMSLLGLGILGLLGFKKRA